MKKIFSFVTILWCITATPVSAQDSCSMRASLLTCTPGDELYSVFGHSALRVSDSATGLDVIFNYGTFDFDDPDFYQKFVKGKLLYFVNVEAVKDFLYAYQYEGRGVTEQELNLSCLEKQQLFDALKTNAREENKYYRYDFLFDNCSTRLRDMIERNLMVKPSYKTIVDTSNVTFRNLIHEYLDRGNQHWNKLGIDLLLGSKIDRPVLNREAMFLPDYLMKGLDSARSAGRELVSSKNVLLTRPVQAEGNEWFTPFIFFLVVFLAVGGLGLLRSGWATRVLGVADFLIFFISGMVGVVIVYMWTATDHVVCRNNFNILWALPTHLIAATFLFSGRRWIRVYLLANAILCGLLLVSWKWLPQQLNIGLMPFVALMLIRSLFHFRKPTV